MSGPPSAPPAVPNLVVLKIGGSVLPDIESIGSAVNEIYRWHREGHRVLAVVSAFAGRTDSLSERARQAPTTERPRILAAGERETATALAEALRTCGISHAIADPEDIALRTDRPGMDARPIGVDRTALHKIFGATDIAIVPGFFGVDEHGAIALFGRGGSDITALFAAHALQAERCRLIKDVDGVYEHDPALPGPAPSRYAQLDYAEALRVADPLLQPKAVRFAQDVGCAFEVATWNQVDATLVHDHRPPVIAARRALARPLRVALLGHGAVGSGVSWALDRDRRRFELVGVLVRDPHQHQTAGSGAARFTTQFDDLLARKPDVIVELIGGVARAGDLINAALKQGLHVITANKALLAERGSALLALAAQHGATLQGSAAVGGALPARELVSKECVHALRAVLNGTTNAILESTRRGKSLGESIHEARQAGLAEADASRDLNGRDALDKLRILLEDAGAASDDWPRLDADPLDWPPPCTDGRRWRQVAAWRRGSKARVQFEALSAEDPFFDLDAEGNALAIEDAEGAVRLHRAAGAGRWPTTASVMADLWALVRNAPELRDDLDPHQPLSPELGRAS